jgi:hypothetical protein
MPQKTALWRRGDRSHSDPLHLVEAEFVAALAIAMPARGQRSSFSSVPPFFRYAVAIPPVAAKKRRK